MNCKKCGHEAKFHTIDGDVIDCYFYRDKDNEVIREKFHQCAYSAYSLFSVDEVLECFEYSSRAQGESA